MTGPPPQALPTTRELTRGQSLLAEPYRACRVMLRFVEPLPWIWHREFLRIHLSPAMLSGGEGGFHQVALSQPHRLGPQTCSGCRRPMGRVGEWDFSCRAPRCPMAGRTQSRRPVRGVVGVEVKPEYVVARDAGGWPELVDRLELVLDRRYREPVLAAVYRTAGQLADQWGWRIR